jgi:hypothetical protein
VRITISETMARLLARQHCSVVTSQCRRSDMPPHARVLRHGRGHVDLERSVSELFTITPGVHPDVCDGSKEDIRGGCPQWVESGR